MLRNPFFEFIQHVVSHVLKALFDDWWEKYGEAEIIIRFTIKNMLTLLVIILLFYSFLYLSVISNIK